jgi:type VI secretion system Hcp family effector
MAIFIDIPDIAGDAKDQGYKKFADSADASTWFIRARGFNFNFTAPDSEEDTEETQTPARGTRPSGGVQLGQARTTGGGNNANSSDLAQNVNVITIEKNLDYASPALADAVANRSGAESTWRGFEKATIYVTSSQREVFLNIELKWIKVTSYQIGINSGDEGTTTEESISLKYESVQWTYKETNTKGVVEYTTDFFKWPKE